MKHVTHALFAALFTLMLGIGVALAQTTHEVMMVTEMIEGRPIPAFYFEPVGLLIQPGDTVRFVAAGPHHTATAYHGQHVKSHRVPEGVGPFSSPVVPVGDVWEHTFDGAGTYDLWCAPHEHYGMAMRIVVGEPGGPAMAPIDDRSPVGVYANAALVLSDPALDPAHILSNGSVSWAEISSDAKELPAQ
ncbi:hypothetical protein BH23DEI1_BH23DEI1_15370 [soil metagenome]